MFRDVDEHMECSSSQQKEYSLYAGESLFNVAVLREEDSLAQAPSAECSQYVMSPQYSPQYTENDKNEMNKKLSSSTEDKNKTLKKTRVAFINFNGDPFSSSSLTESQIQRLPTKHGKKTTEKLN